jgi:type III restriction enzyme
LFQAQPKTDSDNITFEKIKNQLIDVGIPENQIKIKTAGKDEIKNTDLLSKDCEVRFIITVNALKEGWDCPFAYILASLANKTSAVDVEQVLGRILRLPYVRKHQQELLNYSYVFTSSNHFLETLDNIIKGLNKAGFSSKDYRAKEIQEKRDVEYPETEFIPEDLFQNNKDIVDKETEPEIDVDNIKELSDSEQSKEHINNVVIMAHEASEEMERKMEEMEKEDFSLPSEVKEKMNMYPIKEIFKDEVKGIKVPSFYKIIMSDSIIQPQETLVLLTKNMLLDGFDLSKEDHKIDFTKTASEMYNIDLAEGRKDEFLPEYRKVNDKIKERFIDYISTLPLQHQITQLSGLLLNHMRNMDEISDSQLEEYIKRALSGLNSEKISEISNNLYHFARIIREKIISLMERYAEKQFINSLDKGIIICKDSFEFPKSINPQTKIHGITKNLYVEEGDMNDFEKRVINEVANLDSVVFWHRNLERGKGFLINGFINHYPDFIVKMKNGKIIIIETKGDHLDGSASVRKIKLGEKWASKAGDKFRYFMVFENTKLDGAKSLSELIEILKDMK